MKIEFNKLNAKAIILGFLTDIIGSFVIAFILGVIIGFLYASNSGNSNNTSELLKVYYTSLPFMASSLFIGLVFTVLGGYIAGRIAKSYEILNSVAVGVVEVFFGILMIAGSSYPLWYNVIGFLLTIPAAYLGGILARRHHAVKLGVVLEKN